MADTPENIQQVDFDAAHNEYEQWLIFLAATFEGLFSKRFVEYRHDSYGAQKSLSLDDSVLSLIGREDLDRLLAEFQTIFDYAVNAEARIDGELVKLEDIESMLQRFLAVGELCWEKHSSHLSDLEDRKQSELLAGKHRALQMLHREFHSGKGSLEEPMLKLGKSLGFKNEVLLQPDPRPLLMVEGSDFMLNESVTGLERELDQSWDYGNCTLLAQFVEARSSLDFRPFVSLENIAVLADVDIRTVNNATTDKRPEVRLQLEPLVGDITKFVEKNEAIRWLGGRRKKFILTRSRDNMERHSAETPSQAEPLALREVLFLPVANDGTSFEPEFCRSPSGVYTVGAKGSEQKFDDFLEALNELCQMDEPRWRRPNPNGHWGIVKAVGWKRVLRTDTELGEAGKHTPALDEFFKGGE